MKLFNPDRVNTNRKIKQIHLNSVKGFYLVVRIAGYLAYLSQLLVFQKICFQIFFWKLNYSSISVWSMRMQCLNIVSLTKFKHALTGKLKGTDFFFKKWLVSRQKKSLLWIFEQSIYDSMVVNGLTLLRVTSWNFPYINLIPLI